MDYTKLPRQPPAYSPQDQWNGAASAPPTEMVHTTAPAPAPAPAPVHVVNQNTIVVDNQPGGPGLICPHCHTHVKMIVKYHATWKTYLMSLILCAVFFPCVCLPCCCDCCYSTSQFCPKCNACLGRF